ncbi:MULTISPECIES: TetR/AcrR family transcriptional regulator [Rhodococcus]|jgi:AcrR family transcriptional regulator|uniref:TetR/AcrR family transcriptional regulator n=1 Tax=Rhodococcus TaxID=1827 RepID=UPI0002D218C2|nr:MULTISPECIES: TetR/AcrR family transcriptional regulator [Rhodococcus]AKE88185.1 TetR family transcriptional regulator [Rhodococcus aetherivorans]ANZ27191.1 TetR family transcriptional regulator [Rhodococcus sp. WB1]OLL20193.1 TetR family transcriptional regulator [Rhodococcus sp. M8]PND53165.1 TetR family transcriptional regulator [Rhodococcus sp. ENV425]QIX48450.1 TetR family transcriptional regulator [Rhodococcus sp. DMU1]
MRARPYATTSPTRLAAALLEVAARIGLDGASVREVASHAGVSIGAVQHHFPTKDEMLAYSFRALAERVLTRLSTVDPDIDPARTLFAALSQLLPLDDQRTAEAHVMAAFTVRAATSPSLSTIRHTTLFTMRTAVSAVLIRMGTAEPETRAALLLAAVNGLALDAVASPELYPPEYLTHALHTQIQLSLDGADAH